MNSRVDWLDSSEFDAALNEFAFVYEHMETTHEYIAALERLKAFIRVQLDTPRPHSPLIAPRPALNYAEVPW